MRLTFPNGEHAAVNLEHGQVGVGSAAGGGTIVAIAGLSPLHAVFATGRRGSWLTVPQDATVIVNNKAEGSAPLSVIELAREIAGRPAAA